MRLISANQARHRYNLGIVSELKLEFGAAAHSAIFFARKCFKQYTDNNIINGYHTT